MSFLFSKLSWPEVRAAAKGDKVAILPVATIEDHGLHLPVDTDVVIVEAICERTASLIPHKVVLMPTVTYGYSPHHLDFPGTITINWKIFVEYVLDIIRSLVHHGFKRVLIVNGHGSNGPLGEMAARLGVVEFPHTLCAFVSWWELEDVRKEVASFRESAVTSHACELETSIYLAVDQANVRMELAQKDMSVPMSPHFYSDLAGGKPKIDSKNAVKLTEYWSTVTENGVKGDPTKATVKKGKILIETAAKELVEVIGELHQRVIRPRRSHQ